MLVYAKFHSDEEWNEAMLCQSVCAHQIFDTFWFRSSFWLIDVLLYCSSPLLKKKQKNMILLQLTNWSVTWGTFGKPTWAFVTILLQSRRSISIPFMNFCLFFGLDKLVCITTHLCSFTTTYFMIYKLGCLILRFLPCFPRGSWVLLITNHKPTTTYNIKKNIYLMYFQMVTKQLQMNLDALLDVLRGIIWPQSCWLHRLYHHPCLVAIFIEPTYIVNVS